MNKSLLAIAALSIMMASCSQDETIETTSRQAIAFGNVFVENSTRAALDYSYNLGTLKSFEVYGTITNSSNQTANLFNKELVSKSGSDWTYNAEHTQYWIPGNTYNFTAIVDGNESLVTEVETGENQMPIAIKLMDASLQKDILYAESKNISYTSGEKTVAFTFSHLLAKAKFTVKNGIATNNGYSYKVKDVKITNAAANSTYTIGTGWGASSGSYPLSFGHIVNVVLVDANNQNILTNPVDIKYGQSYESNYERLLIPTNVASGATTQLNISFVRELYKDNVLINSETIDNLTTSLKLEEGKAYNFKITLGNPGEPIKFSVERVNGWDNGNTTDTDNDGTKDSTPVN